MWSVAASLACDSNLFATLYQVLHDHMKEVAQEENDDGSNECFIVLVKRLVRDDCLRYPRDASRPGVDLDSINNQRF